MKNNKIYGLLIAAMLMAGCHASRKTTATPIPDPPDQQELSETSAPQRVYTVMNFTGEAEGITIGGQLRVAQDSALWLSANKIFEVARAMATQDSLFLRAPLLGYDVATDYPALRRRLGRKVSYADLQAIALSPDAEEQIAALAKQLGFTVKVSITDRREVEHLAFPYPKTTRP